MSSEGIRSAHAPGVRRSAPVIDGTRAHPPPASLTAAGPRGVSRPAAPATVGATRASPPTGAPRGSAPPDPRAGSSAPARVYRRRGARPTVTSCGVSTTTSRGTPAGGRCTAAPHQRQPSGTRSSVPTPSTPWPSSGPTTAPTPSSGAPPPSGPHPIHPSPTSVASPPGQAHHPGQTEHASHTGPTPPLRRWGGKPT
jgi:hypothetical protein